MAYINLDEDFLSTKDFTQLAGTTVDKLRFYEQKGIFKPVAHGVSSKNKYKYYSPMQLTTFKMIRILDEMKVPASTIKELEEKRTPIELIKILSFHKKMLMGTMSFLQEVYSVSTTFLSLLYEGISIIETDTSVSLMPETPILLGGRNDYNGSDTFFGAYKKFCLDPHVPKPNLSYPIGGYFDTITSFLKMPSQPTHFYSLDPNGRERQAEGLYLVGYTRGYYGQTNDLSQRMLKYSRKEGLRFNGPVYNSYLFDEVSIADPSQYLLRVAVPVIETRKTPKRPRLF